MLSNRSVLPDVGPEEEVLDSNAVSLSPYPSCDSRIQPDHNHAFLSATSSASSLNLLPVRPDTYYERLPFMPNKLSSGILSCDSKPMEKNYSLPLADEREMEESTCSKQSLENSSKLSAECSGLYEEFPEKPLAFSDGLNLSSCEEGLMTGEGNPESEAKNPDYFEDFCHLQCKSSNKEPLSNLDYKNGTHCRELQSAHCHTVQINPKQSAACESVTQLSSSSSVSESSDVGTLLNECGRPTLPRDDELAALQHRFHELQEHNNQLEEQLKNSEAEKQQLQAELGRFLFLEDKGRRNQKLLLLSRESVSDQSRLCAGSASSALMSMDGKLLGGAGPLQEPSKSTFYT